jgi:hypothetical protein
MPSPIPPTGIHWLCLVRRSYTHTVTAEPSEVEPASSKSWGAAAAPAAPIPEGANGESPTSVVWPRAVTIPAAAAAARTASAGNRPGERRKRGFI